MKKFTIAILAIIYFTMTSGIVFNVHYCRGKISSVKVDLLAKNLCGCKKKETKKGCCKTEHKLVKLEDNHKASAAHFACDVPVAILPTTTHNFNSILNYNNTITAFNSLPPPTLSQEAIYKRNCVFRI